MRDFKELRVWQHGHRLTLAVYKATRVFPKEELYGLTSQLRRASTSIPSNIAEGTGRGSDAEMVRFLRIALGSANETEYQLLLAHDLGYLSDADYEPLKEDTLAVKRMLNAFIQTLSANSQRPKANG